MATKKNTRKTTKAVRPASAVASRTTTKNKRSLAKKSETKMTRTTPSELYSAPIRSKSDNSPVKMKRSYLVIGLIVLLLAGLLYLLRSVFIAATVNGQPISRISVVHELEKQSGKQALNTIVTKTLIMQEANKEHVTVSDSEVSTEMKKIEANVKQQGQTLDQVLALQGMDRAALTDQIKVQKLVEKMLGKDIKVSDKEVQDYIAKNQASLGADTTSVAAKGRVKQQLTQQKLSDKFQSWLQNLQKNAKINYYVKY